MKVLQGYLPKIPSEYKKEYLITLCRENLLKMLVAAVVLVAVELVVAFFLETPESASFYLALSIALFAVVFTPILYYFRKYIDRLSNFFIMLVQSVFLIGILISSISWSLYEQPWNASSSTYFLAVFAVAAFIVMPPFVSAGLLLSSNLTFVMLLPQFQAEGDIIATLSVNTLSMTTVAWGLNQMASRKERISFLNKKIILETNMELEKMNIELNELTTRDSMTNLVNHKNSIRRLKEEVDRAKRIDYPLSVAMIDLDNFKLVNDTYGHQAGDEVLIQVARILEENCRITDIVGRYGGEEFIIIMPDTSDRDAALLLERIQAIIEGTCFKDGIHVTLSCGISELSGESIHGVLKSSDVMLYEAKKKGKNRIEVQINNEKKSAAIN